MIDLSANYLPGFIGGSEDSKSCALRIKNQQASGVEVMVLTPRYYPSKLSVEEFIERRDKAINALGNGSGRYPKLVKACEVYVDKELDSISTIGRLAVEGTRTIIADMPSGAWESDLLNTLYGIESADYKVVIAHIDRYPKRYAEDLFALGYRGIADVSAFYGFNFFKHKRLKKWIDDGNIIGIGSNFDRKCRNERDRMSRLPEIIGKARTEKLERESRRLLGIK